MKLLLILPFPKAGIIIALTKKIAAVRNATETYSDLVKRTAGEDFECKCGFFAGDCLTVTNESLFTNKDGSRTKSESAILKRAHELILRGWTMCSTEPHIKD